MTFGRTTKFVLTVGLFLAAAAMVWVADLVNSTGPLFAGWIPLLLVMWVLTRPEEHVEPQTVADASGQDEPSIYEDGAQGEEPDA